MAKLSMTQHEHQPDQGKTAVGAGLKSVTVDQRIPGVDDGGEGDSSSSNAQQVTIPATTIAPPNLDASLTASAVGAGSASSPVGGVSSSGASGGAPGLQPPAAAATPGLSRMMTPSKVNTAAAVAGETFTTSTVVGAPSAVLGNDGEAATSPNATPQGDAVVAAGEASSPVVISAAVNEDLAYSHRESVLQSYAIRGSVRVAAGAPAQLRVTDPHGHIANVTANDAVAEENAAVSKPSKREYSCKAGAMQQDGAPPKFVTTLIYRCSPAVKVLPVRVTCRLRSAGNSVLVWAQVIANPQLSQPLSGVSVLVNLPFLPRNEEVRDCTVVEGGNCHP